MHFNNMENTSAATIEKESLEDIASLNKKESNNDNKKKHPKLKFLLYFWVIIIATAIALFLSLYQDFDGVVASLMKADWRYLLLILAIVLFTYCVDGFIIFIFARLYTRKYKYHQGVATSFIGAFYSAVTPGASGGQPMQVYTMKKQGVETSNGASIMVMGFIVYQVALIVIGIFSLVFSAGSLISTIGSFEISFGDSTLSIPAIPLTIAGFVLNVMVILGLFLMSYSHKFHNLIMHYGIDFLAKLKILKKPEETRESLRIQVENFKIELRRLFSNIPILLVVFLCYSIILILRFSIPFFAGLALDGYGFRMNLDGTLITQTITDASGNIIGYEPVLSTGGPDFLSFWQSVFLSAYHQMTTGLIPLPGSAGVSEYFFNLMYEKYFVSQQVTSAAQIIWRFSTFHLVLVVSGIVAATYRSSPKNEIHHANRKTFVTMQLETFDTRKASADSMYETASLSRKEIQNKLKSLGKRNNNKNDKPKESKPRNKNVIKKSQNKAVAKVDEVFDEIKIGDDE